MDLRKLKGYLGLASRAGKLTFGAELACQLVRDRKARIVLIDSSSSDNTKKKVTDACRTCGVPFEMLEPGFIAASCGKPNVMVTALSGGSLCEAVIEAVRS